MIGERGHGNGEYTGDGEVRKMVTQCFHNSLLKRVLRVNLPDLSDSKPIVDEAGECQPDPKITFS
jgi:hypothetical protein